jgi:hypothetical protein
VVLVTGLIPVTGGQLVQLPCGNECVTLQLPDGSWAEFCGLCDYWASLTQETGETMPYDLPEDKTPLWRVLFAGDMQIKRQWVNILV